MPITYATNVATLQDAIAVEEAEALLEWLQEAQSPNVDLSACTHLHPANLQVLMAGRPVIAAWPSDVALASLLRSALDAP
jgi:hypothetical protein